MLPRFASLIATLAFLTPLTLTRAQTLWLGTGATDPASCGIYRTSFDDATGQLIAPTRVAQLARATFIAVDSAKNLLVSIGETSAKNADGKTTRTAVLASFRINPDLSLSAIDSKHCGAGPCHVSLDTSGRVAFVSNYQDLSLVSFLVQPDGHLQGPVSIMKRSGSGPHPKRQQAAHVHSARVFPGAPFVAACELGTDLVTVFAFDPATAVLTEHSRVKLPPGSGPRHLAFHPTRPLAFTVNELNQSLSVLSVDSAQGQLTLLQSLSSRPSDSPAADAVELTSADVRVHPNGNYIYTSTRDLTPQKRDYVSVFALDEKSSATLVEAHPVTARIPRSFNLSPTGKWLIVGGQKSEDLAVLAIDPATGKLTPHGDPTRSPGGPICVNFAQP